MVRYCNDGIDAKEQELSATFGDGKLVLVDVDVDKKCGIDDIDFLRPFLYKKMIVDWLWSWSHLWLCS